MNRFVTLAILLACNPAPSASDLDSTRGGEVQVFFNEPGSRAQNMWEPDAVRYMIQMVDSAESTIDMAVMGFSHRPLIDALIRADLRGVRVRMVGDAGHAYNSGYVRFRDEHIPIQMGNMAHIMHNKFMVVDGRFVWCGTANWSDSDLRQNSNNFISIDHPGVAADFTDEFEQMFSGKFGAMKQEIDNGRVYEIGDTTIELWFSPNEDAMGRMLEIVDAAQDSVRFSIFAFTKDSLGSALVRKQAEFARKDAAEGVDRSGDFTTHRSVAGVIDKSQLHSNGQFHEVYRLIGAGIPMRLDGNENSIQPGDYQAGGGRLHSKTMIIDENSENPTIITGSFNWSASATQSNDEYLMVIRGGRIARQYQQYWEGLWRGSSDIGGDFVGDEGLDPGSIVINEIMWYGMHAADADGFDEYIELRNLSDRWVNLDLWQIANPDDVVVGFPPGSRIPPRGLFTILDHTTEPYADGQPLDDPSAFRGGDLIVNPYNDNRQARLYIKDGALELFLKDPRGVEMDRAGNGGPAYAGGPSGGKVRSMERDADPGDGADPDAWHACTLDEGGENVTPEFRATMIGTPGEENSAR